MGFEMPGWGSRGVLRRYVRHEGRAGDWPMVNSRVICRVGGSHPCLFSWNPLPIIVPVLAPSCLSMIWEVAVPSLSSRIALHTRPLSVASC